jgi:serine/threonine protein kinase
MDINNICINCMENSMFNNICTKCNYNFDEEKSPGVGVLSYKTILKNRFLTGRVLGVGGFGITYLALDMENNQKIAIKEYMPRGLAIRDNTSKDIKIYNSSNRDIYFHGLNKFIDEANNLLCFRDHPGIVYVMNCFKENNTAYIIMEYLEGVTLKDFLKVKGSKISFDTTYKIMLPVLDALKEVHKTGILHRDISPDNIFITNKGQVKLLDFGAARYVIGQKSRNLSVILKAGYSPPEQYYSKGVQGSWTDIYASAATMYRCICGKMPEDAMQRLSEDNLELPRALGADILESQERVLLKAMSVNRKDRYQDVYELINAFNNCLSNTANNADNITSTLNENRDINKTLEKDDKEKANYTNEKRSDTRVGSSIIINSVLAFLLGLSIILKITDIISWTLFGIFVVSLFIIYLLAGANKTSDNKTFTATEYEPKNPYIKGLSGYYKDAEIPIINKRINLGRDINYCQIIFPLETKGISRRHCSISYIKEKNIFQIEDSSTFGTFLQNGRKIEKGQAVTIKPGDRIYLCNKDDMFELNVK